MSGDDAKSIPTEDIEALIEIFDKSDWDEMHLVITGLDFFISRSPDATPPSGKDGGAGRASSPAAVTEATRQEDGAGADHDHAAPEMEERPHGYVDIRAPNLGVFYVAPKPGADPYVQVGDRIEEDTPIGLVEVMKLFTTIYAGTKGTIREILVEDAQMVEYDQVLMLVEPDEQ